MDLYQEVKAELMAKGAYTAIELYDYSASRIALLFDRFFNFCYVNLRDHCHEYNIHPARLIIFNDVEVNACATSFQGYNLIEINNGLIYKMYAHFYDNNKAFTIDKYLMEEYAPLFPEDAPADFIMYQVTPQFTYYHELAHLIQNAPLLKKSFSERTRHADGDFDVLSHLLEFDADLHAAQMLYFHIEEFWKKMPVGNQSSETIGKLISIYASAIFVYFTFLEEERESIYFEKYSHPHPLIRITYVLDIIIGVAEQNLKKIILDKKLILKEAFNITSLMDQANGRMDSVSAYAERYKLSNVEITNYVNKLASLSNDIPYLVKNRPQPPV